MFIVTDMANWMVRSSPPWEDYLVAMAFHIVTFDKHMEVIPVEMWQTLHRALAKLVFLAAVDQAKMA